MGVTIRSASTDEAAAVLELWRAAAAEPTSTDDLESIEVLLSRDPEALLIAVDSGHVVGTAIAGWDGWRASIYRLAVLPRYRQQGVASSLVAEAERRVQRRGAVRLSAIVVADDGQAMGFWRSIGWDEQDRRRRFVKNVGRPGVRGAR